MIKTLFVVMMLLLSLKTSLIKKTLSGKRRSPLSYQIWDSGKKWLHVPDQRNAPAQRIPAFSKRAGLLASGECWCSEHGRAVAE